MDLGLKNKTVLITGASGGIGSDIARKFAYEGAELILHAGQNRQSAQKLSEELSTKSLVVQADVGNEDEVKNLFKDALGKFGKLDVVVANAGFWAPDDQPIEDVEKKRWDEVIAANLTGVWLTAREYFRYLKKTKPESANLIITGSTAGIYGEAGQSDYAAAKAGLIGLMLTLKNEITRIVPKGRVNLVAPGWTLTSKVEEGLKSDTNALKRALQTRSIRSIARASDVANQVVFLASDLVSGQITGQIVKVAGGMEGRVLWEKDEIDIDQA